MTTIDDRVSAGAAWLDEHRPGWWQRINLETLDLGDPCRCVLGQEYGHFDGRPEEVDFHEDEFGFDRRARTFEVYTEIERDYRMLTAEWRELIQARRDEVAVTT